MDLRIAILTVSDRVSRGDMVDAGGPAIVEALAGGKYQIVAQEVVPDELDRIANTLRRWSDSADVDVVFTTGGTGLGPRDVTPEATVAACQRIVPGIGEALRRAGLEKTPQSMLSRAVAAVRGNTLIINLPGSPRGARDGVLTVLPVLEHALATLRGATH